MQVAELIGKTPDQLKDMLTGLKKELFNLRFQRAAGEAGNLGRPREVKKDIARILTVINGGASTAKAVEAKPAKKPAVKKATSKKAKKEE